MFVYAAENSISEYYLTEKFFEPFQLGVIPVVVGHAITAKELCPPASAIFALDFLNAKQLAQRLISIFNDETEWRSFYTWKNQEIAPEFLSRNSFASKPTMYSLGTN